jgi:hypothetical protein
MEKEIILCIPGPWTSRSEFLRAIIEVEPFGEFMFAGHFLTHPKGNDRVEVTYEDGDPRMAESFKIAGQGKISEATLEQIAFHGGVTYLHFPMDLPGQRERIIKFTDVVRRAGGIAIKVESSGVAHEWSSWSYRITGEEFDLYCSACLLVVDDLHYYSCGMHHFGLPECSVPAALDVQDAADLVNRFNLFQIIDQPKLNDGHTFSVDDDAPRYRLTLEEDRRNEPDDLFHNPHGVWVLAPCS